METKLDTEINQLLDEAEARQSCASSGAQRLRRAMDRRCQRGTLTSPMRGLYARSDQWHEMDLRSRRLHVIRGLARQHPTWVFCQASAALIYGLAISPETTELVHVAVPLRSRTPACEGVVFHIVEGDEPEVRGGVLTTSLLRTTLDCLLTFDFRDGLAVADSYLRLTGSGSDELCGAVRGRCRSVFDVRRVLRTIKLANPLAENYRESVARAAMIELGYEPPRLKVPIPGTGTPGNPLKADFSWTRADGTPVYAMLEDGGDPFDMRFVGEAGRAKASPAKDGADGGRTDEEGPATPAIARRVPEVPPVLAGGAPLCEEQLALGA